MSAGPGADPAAEDGLPLWLRELQGQGSQQPPTGYGQPPAAPYAPPNVQAGYRQAPHGQPQPQPGYADPSQRFGQMQQGYGPASQNMQASDLISEDGLPEWLRNAASGPLSGSGRSGQAGAYPSQAASNGWAAPAGSGQPGAPLPPRYASPGGNGAGPGMSGPLGSGQLGFGQPASALFDESALPDWLRQASMGQEIDAAPPASQRLPGTSPISPGYGAPGGALEYGAGATGYTGYQPPQEQQALGPRMPASAQRGQPVPQGFEAAQASAFPSIEQAGAYRPAPPSQAGVSGRSLLDSGALSGWLGGQPGASAHSVNGMPSNPAGMPAQSLVDESALPQWLHAEPSAPVRDAPNGVGRSFAPETPNSSNWLASPAAAEELPPWLNQIYTDANVPRTEPRPAGLPMAGGIPGGPGAQGAPGAPGYGVPAYGTPDFGTPLARGTGHLSGGTVAASDFVDESALPDWLKSQGAVENAQQAAISPSAYAPPAPSAYLPAAPIPPVSAGLPSGTVPEHRVAPLYQPTGEASDGSQAHFAASDLIDPSALPSWVAAQEPPPVQSFSSTTGWTVKQPAASPMRPESNLDSGDDFAGGEGRSGTGRFRRPDPNESSWQYQSGMDGRFAERDEAAQQSGGRYSQQQRQAPAPHGDSREHNGSYGRMPEPEADWRGAGNGIGKRRGAPIPSGDLPPWLQGTGPTSGGQRQMGRPGTELDWEAGAQGTDQQWNDWDDQPDGGNNSGYSQQDEYADYDYDEEYGGSPEQERRSGWRRLFGRK
jgi:hypothetical protein